MRRALSVVVALLIVLGLAMTTWAAEGTMDLTKAAQTVSQREIRPFEMYLFIAVVYWMCTYSMSRFSRWLEVRMSPERAPTKRLALKKAAA